MKPLSEVVADDVTKADLVFVGAWIEGFIIVGVGPARTALKRIGELPLSGKNVASFCTFGFNPRGSLEKLRSALESRGGKVVAEKAFARKRAAADAAAFAAEVLAKR